MFKGRHSKINILKEKNYMNSKKKYLTIEEKKTLAMEGKDVPLCAYDEGFISKIRRKMEQRKKAKIFSKNI